MCLVILQDTLEWSAVKTKGNKPSARWGHASSFHAEKGVMYVHGGRNTDSYFDELFEFHVG